MADPIAPSVAAALGSRVPPGRRAVAVRVDELAGRLVPWLGGAALVLALLATVFALFIAPPDAKQGDAYRIVFVHVPAAWMSLLLYLVMGFFAALSLVRNARLAALTMAALAPTGTLFTLVALGTGSLWGKPTWGAWWVWDARLTAELVLLFLYLGFLGLRSVIGDSRRADRASAVLVLIGVLNFPLVYFSVRWWNTLHQGAAAGLLSSPGMARTVLAGMLAISLAFCMYAAAVVLARLRCLMLERDGGASDSMFQELKP